jgi:cleavage stimulation factor subunit 3
MADLSPAHIQAKTVLRELRRRTATLFPPTPSRQELQLPQRPTFTTTDRQLVGAWKSYLKWEESNPLELEDKAVLVARLQSIYRKALIRMRFFSEIW